MNLMLNTTLASNYKSNTQIARVLTENWVVQNMYCPHCGNNQIKHFENNLPVADFYCPICCNEYELKSKNGKLGRKITDGAYSTMIERITSNNNPDFFFLSYSKQNMVVNDFIFVPKYFFVPAIIEKRKPLAESARRAGWIGCNILIDKIPKQGKIPIISNGSLEDTNIVIKKVKESAKLKTNNIDTRGWLFDILNCVNNLPKTFTLNQVYEFEKALQAKHPSNNNIKPKIRQQLQFLRDKGFIIFLGNGKYEKVL